MEIEHHRIVYISDDDVYGELVVEGAYASTVRYSLDGIGYEVILLNEEFEIVEDISIELEEED